MIWYYNYYQIDKFEKAFEGGSLERGWNAAESYCNQFGADLASFHSEEEMLAVYARLNWNQNSGSFRFYWIGLNDLITPNKLEWIDTQGLNPLYDFKYWSVDGENYDAVS